MNPMMAIHFSVRNYCNRVKCGFRRLNLVFYYLDIHIHSVLKIVKIGDGFSANKMAMIMIYMDFCGPDGNAKKLEFVIVSQIYGTRGFNNLICFLLMFRK